MISIYTDGACANNKKGCGFGGYGYVIIDSDKKIVYKNGGSINDTTNNVMEMVSVIAALKEANRIYTKKCGSLVCTIYSDSKYVVDNWNDNLIKWIDKGWVTSKGVSVSNRKYWELLYHMTCHFQMVKFVWVKGHSDNKHNEEANDIASSFINKKRSPNERNEMPDE